MIDPRLELAKAVPILDVAQKLGLSGLRRITSQEHAGPCPVCGGHEKRNADRFAINTARQVWNCRMCGQGGDGLALVQHALGCDFRAALAYLAGDEVAAIDPAELARRRKYAADQERKRRDFEAKARAEAIRQARAIWAEAQGVDVAPAAAYLAGRGIVFEEWPPSLRFLPAHPYRKHFAGRVQTWFSGPCMIAGIQNAEGRVVAVHQTYLEIDGSHVRKARITAPDGSLEDGKGNPWPAKLVRGSKKGGAIRLTRQDPAGRMVMAEGIETTGSVLMAGVWPGATFWAGVDLGNMSGRQLKVEGQRHSGVPDMTDAEAWLPPDWVAQLMLAQDGDSAPKPTKAKLLACGRRAMAARPGLQAQIMAAETGADFNDMWQRMQAEGHEHGHQ